MAILLRFFDDGVDDMSFERGFMRKYQNLTKIALKSTIHIAVKKSKKL